MTDNKKIGDDDDPVDTDIDLETNVKKKTELGTSDLVARKLMENTDYIVVTEKDISFDDLTINGNYSDSDILE